MGYLDLSITSSKNNYSNDEDIIIQYSVRNISKFDLFLVNEVHHIYSPYERTIEVGFAINPPKTLEMPYSFSPPQIKKLTSGESWNLKISVPMPLKINYFNGEYATFKIPMTGPVSLYLRQGYGLTPFESIQNPTNIDFLRWQNLQDSVKSDFTIQNY